MTHEEDEDLKLAPSTMDALAEFIRERDEASRRFAELEAQAQAAHEDRQFSMADFSEDWNQSQFWYDDETAEVFASTLLAGATKDSVIGLVSAPTVYVKIREWKRVGKVPHDLKVVLLEYDQRFAVFKDDFVHYDFANPLRLPPELKGRFDRVLADPPFLSEDCQTKTALTMRWMVNKNPKVVICTGERMRDLILRLYRPVGVKETTLEVKHKKGLSNEFLCYANFDSEHWERIEEEGA